MNSRTIAHFIRLQPSILHYVELGCQCGKAGEETVGSRCVCCCKTDTLFIISHVCSQRSSRLFSLSTLLRHLVLQT